MDYSESPHRPLHLYTDDSWYFITASTVNRLRILSTPGHCYIWCTEMFSAVQELRIKLAGWVLLRNHYHLLLKIRRGRDIPKFMKFLNGRSSFRLNEVDGCRGRQVWYSYWDVCIGDDDDFRARLNYIHYNPVMHGYVENAEDWEFSSYRLHMRRARLHDLDTHLTQKD